MLLIVGCILKSVKQLTFLRGRMLVAQGEAAALKRENELLKERVRQLEEM